MCVRVRMYVYIYMYMCIYTYTHIHMNTHARARAHTNTRTLTYTLTQTQRHTERDTHTQRKPHTHMLHILVNTNMVLPDTGVLILTLDLGCLACCLACRPHRRGFDLVVGSHRPNLVKPGHHAPPHRSSFHMDVSDPVSLVGAGSKPQAPKPPILEP